MDTSHLTTEIERRAIKSMLEKRLDQRKETTSVQVNVELHSSLSFHRQRTFFPFFLQQRHRRTKEIGRDDQFVHEKSAVTREQKKRLFCRALNVVRSSPQFFPLRQTVPLSIVVFSCWNNAVDHPTLTRLVVSFSLREDTQLSVEMPPSFVSRAMSPTSYPSQ